MLNLNHRYKEAYQMCRLTKIAAALTLCLLWVGSVFAITLDDIIERHAEALGGMDALLQVKSARTVATIKMAGMKGESVIYFKAPNKIRTDIALPLATITQAYDGHRAWTKDLNGQLRDLSGDELKNTVTSVFFASGDYLKPEYRGSSVVYEGDEDVDGTNYHVLTFAPDGGLKVKAFVNAETYMIDFMDMHVQMFDVRMTQEDFRPVDGIMVPFHNVQKTGIPTADLDATTTEQEFNVDIPDSIFRFPGAPAVDFALRKARPATVKLDIRAFHLYLPVYVNGNGPHVFILDSGAGLTVIGRELAAELSLPETGELPAVGAGGVEVGSFARVDSVEIGSAVIYDLVIGKIGLATVNQFTMEPIAGIIGYDLFTRFMVSIDYYDSVLVIYPPDAAIEADQAVIPLDIEMNHPIIEANVDDSIRGRFRIDTGSSSYLDMSNKFSTRYDLINSSRTKPVAMELRGIGDDITRTNMGRLASFDLGGLELTDLPCGFASDDAGIFAIESVDGNVGGGVLSNFTCTFDYGNKMLMLEPNDDFDKPADLRATGLRLRKDGDEVVVRSIVPGSSADMNSIEVGDVLISVDGVSVEGMDLFGVIELLEPDDRESVVVEVNGDNGARKITLDRKNLF
jgi:outer membrane lipoprotein-sorting protein